MLTAEQRAWWCSLVTETRAEVVDDTARHLAPFESDIARLAVADHLTECEDLLTEMADALAEAVIATPIDEEMLNVDAESVRGWLAKVKELGMGREPS